MVTSECCMIVWMKNGSWTTEDDELYSQHWYERVGLLSFHLTGSWHMRRADTRTISRQKSNPRPRDKTVCRGPFNIFGQCRYCSFATRLRPSRVKSQAKSTLSTTLTRSDVQSYVFCHILFQITYMTRSMITYIKIPVTGTSLLIPQLNRHLNTVSPSWSWWPYKHDNTACLAPSTHSY